MPPRWMQRRLPRKKVIVQPASRRAVSLRRTPRLSPRPEQRASLAPPFAVSRWAGALGAMATCLLPRAPTYRPRHSVIPTEVEGSVRTQTPSPREGYLLPSLVPPTNLPSHLSPPHSLTPPSASCAAWAHPYSHTTATAVLAGTGSVLTRPPPPPTGGSGAGCAPSHHTAIRTFTVPSKARHRQSSGERLPGILQPKTQRRVAKSGGL